MKRSYKFKALGDVQSVVSSAPSLDEAARRLGVNRSTLTRWLQSGKVKRPQPKEGVAAGATAGQSPDEWAQRVRELGEMDPTRSTLLDLAVEALRMSRDVECRPETRLSAMGRYQQLVRQLNIDAGQTIPKPTTAPATTRPALARSGGDPRAVLMAVK